MAKRQTKKPLWRGWVGGLLIALVGLYVVYLIGVNVFFGTALFRNFINDDPEKLFVEYTSATSVVPGVLDFKDLRLRGRTPSVEWFVACDECRFNVKVTDLLSHSLSAKSVHASGLTVRVRQRLLPWMATPRLVAELPPIPGFSDPPLRSLWPSPPPMTPADDDFWAIELPVVEVEHVRQIWIDAIRFDGDARSTGGWAFHHDHRIEVGPAMTVITAGTVSTGRDVVVEGVEGTVETTIGPYDVRMVSGIDILRNVSAVTTLRGVLHGAEMLNAQAPGEATRFGGGRGPVRLDVRVVDGVLMPGSRGEIESMRATADNREVGVEASVRATFEVTTPAEGAPLGIVEGELLDVEVALPTHDNARFLVPRATLRIESTDLDLTHPYEDGAALLVVKTGASPDLRWVTGFLPKESGLRVEQGVGTASVQARMDIGRRRVSATAVVGTKDMRLSMGHAELSGDVATDLEIRELDLPRHAIDLSGSRAAWTHASATWTDHGKTLTATSPRVEAVASTLDLEEGGVPPKARFVLDVPEVSVADMRGLGALVPPSVDASFESGSAVGHAHAELALPEKVASGRAEVRATRVGMRYGGLRVVSDVAARAHLDRLAYEGAPSAFVSSAHAHITNVSARGSHEAGSVRVGQVDVDGAALSMGGPQGTSGRVSIDVPDVELPDARVANVLFDPKLRLRVDSGSGKGRLHADLDLRTKSGTGHADVRLGQLALDYHGARYTADVVANVKATGDPRRGHTIDLSQSLLTLSRTSVSHAPLNTEAWWGALLLKDAAIHFEPNGPRFDGRLVSWARDGRPFAALLVNDTKLPDFVAKAMEMQTLDASATLEVYRGGFAVHDLSAHGSHMTVDAFYRRTGHENHGALLVESGPVTAGFGAKNGSTRFVLFGAKGWFAAQEREDKREGAARAGR